MARWNSLKRLKLKSTARKADSGRQPVNVSLPFKKNLQPEMISRRLNLPVISESPEDAGDHFGWFAHFAAGDCPASSAQTQAGLAPDASFAHSRYRPAELF